MNDNIKRIVPNEAGIRLHLYTHICKVGVLGCGGQMIFISRGGGQLKIWEGIETPVPPTIRALIFMQ